MTILNKFFVYISAFVVKMLEQDIYKKGWNSPEKCIVDPWGQIQEKKCTYDWIWRNLWSQHNETMYSLVKNHSKNKPYESWKIENRKCQRLSTIASFLPKVHFMTLWHWCCLLNSNVGCSFWRPKLKKSG